MKTGAKAGAETKNFGSATLILPTFKSLVFLITTVKCFHTLPSNTLTSSFFQNQDYVSHFLNQI
jgi:hypothetical protein